MSNVEQAVVIGIDLAGPANFVDTALCCFDGTQVTSQSGVSDQDIVNFLQQFDANRPILIAIDAPLTYQEGGGYRDVDRVLRKTLNARGFSKIGVMAPTMTKMVYLTLRGLRLRELCSSFDNIAVFETHPGAALVFDQVDYSSVTQIKTQPTVIELIWRKLTGRYVFLESVLMPQNDHQLMAIAAMLSAYRYQNHQALLHFESEIIGQPALIL